MINTLPEPKRSAISSIRNKLLSLGFAEEVEFDSINIEPVLIYSKTIEKVVLLKHKWELVALIPIESESIGIRKENFSIAGLNLEKSEFEDDDGKSWLKFSLPTEEKTIIEILEKNNLS